MALYDEIVNPYDSVPNLLRIVRMLDNDGKPIERKVLFPGHLYDRVIHEKPNSQSELERYSYEFNKYVRSKNYNAFFKYLKFVSSNYPFDEAIKGTIDKMEKDEKLSESVKKRKVASIKEKTLYPISDFIPILENFDDYQSFIDFYKRNGYDKYHYDLTEILFYPESHPVDDFLKKTGLSFDMYYMISKMHLLILKMNKKFSGGPGVMGFHVNPQSLNLSTTTPRERSDIKFYLNAGPDTYKVAYLFQKECIKNKVNYYYKVADPSQDETSRIDKMCIYSNFEDAQVFLDIIKKIKAEHPEIKFSKPPIFSGMIDGYIGVGQDNLDENSEFKESFNYGMSYIIMEAKKETFKDVEGSIFAAVKKDQNLLFKFRDNIIKQAELIGMDTTKMCLNKTAKKKLKSNGYGTK